MEVRVRRPRAGGGFEMRSGGLVSVLLVGLTTVGCAHPVSTAIGEARGGTALPDGFVLTYDDRAGVSGGSLITVVASGELILQEHRPGFAPASDQPEASHFADGLTEEDALASVRGALQPREVRALLDALAEVEAWSHRPDGREPPLESRQATLRVEVAEGESEMWEWFRELERNERLIRVREVLARVITRLRDEARDVRDDG